MNRLSSVVKSLTPFMVASVLSSCVSLTPVERQTLNELRSYGIRINEQKVKDPGVAGVLNLLPGFGNFYLMSEGSEQTGPGVMNLLLWPYSPIWGIPQAAIDAETYNQKATVSFYTLGLGKNKLYELRKSNGYDFGTDDFVPLDELPSTKTNDSDSVDKLTQKLERLELEMRIKDLENKLDSK
jgi:hypothetical protein